MHGTYAISNQPTIRIPWDQASQDLIGHAIEAGWWPAGDNRPFDFARAYTDPGPPLQVSQIRLQRSRQLLADAARQGKIGFGQATRVLRDHYEDTFLGGALLHRRAARPEHSASPTLPTSSHTYGGAGTP